MINLKQNFLNAWIKCLTFILGVLGFNSCNVFNEPEMYGCPPDDYKRLSVEVKGNIVNKENQNLKCIVTVKTTEDGVNYMPFDTIKTNDYGFYQFNHLFYDRCVGLRFVVSDDKNYYLSDSVDVVLIFHDGYSVLNKEFNFTLTPRIEF
ncbi:MAG: hypothetical protein II956_00210 [Bacteroidales bacterium]|nr:hypothetical protein [Bacteroidales bacterium]